jgi:ABC-type polysaccharide/polyol phosphate export permease
VDILRNISDHFRVGVLNSRSLIAKVYFPREIVPLSYVFAALADLAIATALTMVALVCTGHNIPATAIELLPISLVLIIYAAAFSVLLSIAQIGFRDIAIGMPLLLQGLMLAVLRACRAQGLAGSISSQTTSDGSHAGAQATSRTRSSFPVL